jgi:hypothetical protein
MGAIACFDLVVFKLIIHKKLDETNILHIYIANIANVLTTKISMSNAVLHLWYWCQH